MQYCTSDNAYHGAVSPFAVVFVIYHRRADAISIQTAAELGPSSFPNPCGDDFVWQIKRGNEGSQKTAREAPSQRPPWYRMIFLVTFFKSIFDPFSQRKQHFMNIQQKNETRKIARKRSNISRKKTTHLPPAPALFLSFSPENAPPHTIQRFVRNNLIAS